MDVEPPAPPLEPPLEPPRAPDRRWIRIGAWAIAVAAVLIVIGTTVELPAYSIGPGPARDVGGLVTVEGETTYPSEGRFFLTTVLVSDSEITIFEALRAWLDPATSVVDRSTIIRPGLDDRRQDLLNKHDIEASKVTAEVVALRTLGHPVRELPGARVLTVIPETPAEGVIEPGDRILAVDGAAVAGPEELGDAIAAREIGEPVRLALERDGERREVRVPTAASLFEEGRASVGVTVFGAFDRPFRVSIDTQNIGGPSGGLVFALAIIDALTEDDLTHGLSIAATGTVDLEGAVGRVGGVDEKVRAAERSGADVFLVPADEVGAAERAAGEVRVIGVRTVAEALAALRDLGESPAEGSGEAAARAA